MQIEGSRGEKESGEIRIFSKGFPSFTEVQEQLLTNREKKLISLLFLVVAKFIKYDDLTKIEFKKNNQQQKNVK